MRVLRSSLTLPSLFILLCLAQTQAKTTPQPSDSTYGNLPLTFEPNQGQLSPNFQFMSHGEDYSLSFQPDKVAVTLTSFQGSSFHSSSSSGRDAVSASTHDSFLIQLLGAAPNAQSSAEDPTITRSNYFLGNNPANWHTGIPNYRRIRYREIYPGIDLVYYGNHRRLEHDFIVAPYADPTRIELAFPDATTLSIDKDTGDLLIHTANSSSNSTPRLLKPVSYQLIQGQRREITSHFALLDNQHVSFSLGSYDNSRPLTIDPVLVYSTYLGGSGGGDQGNGIAVDSSGDAYIVGTTHSTDFPGTAGSFQTQDNAAANLPTVFVSKLNPAGTALVYSTYLGGSGGDYGYGIALDASNNAYITGATYSTDFPVTCNAFLPANPSQTAGAPTSFVAKLAANGAALTYSTYLGGSGSQSGSGDVSQAIAVDSSGDAYLTGYTFSADFPVTDSAFQATFAGNASISNAFVAKLNPGGTGLVYATYLGGSVSNQGYGGDLGNSIAID
ncbi:MAG TPA: SBBP repeat-containing protein, partial [Acidobacteriaceae bacterium]|nr:SBBP repeat-containing protein [Acidobacteriaceae bacterium]